MYNRNYSTEDVIVRRDHRWTVDQAKRVVLRCASANKNNVTRIDMILPRVSFRDGVNNPYPGCRWFDIQVLTASIRRQTSTWLLPLY